MRAIENNGTDCDAADAAAASRYLPYLVRFESLKMTGTRDFPEEYNYLVEYIVHPFRLLSHRLNMTAQTKTIEEYDLKQTGSTGGSEQQVGQITDYHDNAKLRRKIDMVLLPFLCGIYFLQYLDKTCVDMQIQT